MARTSDATAARLLNAAAKITSPPRMDDLAYMARPFIQVTLPHRDPGPQPQWHKRNGRFAMTITPYRDQSGQPRYPYGSIARLLLFWIVTEAKRTQNRHLDLGPSMNEFMRKVGFNPDTGGGKRGDARRVRQHMLSLVRAHIVVSDGTASWLNMPLADAGQVWWSHAAPDQHSLFGSFIILGEAFFQTIDSGSVPVDRRVLQHLRRSPMALDLYTWAAYRVFTLEGRSAFIPWKRLNEQLGAGYADPGNFQRAALGHLRRVAAFYRGLRFRVETGGVRLLPSLPAVPPRGSLPLIHGETVHAPKPRPRKAAPTYPPKPTVKRYE
ncbi:MAG: plasmid encoded RepA protein [Alphaproteobacteria bacterium]|nr:plasmid encoded RepA protein [Alphaproteobacteria bacterium]